MLLVDDHPMNRELGKALLTLAAARTVTAEDGAQALRAVQADDFDLVLMDVHMPGMDGLAAARAIRALPGPVGPSRSSRSAPTSCPSRSPAAAPAWTTTSASRSAARTWSPPSLAPRKAAKGPSAAANA
ncbi:response regulator [Caulobacter segnis]